jgi:hypothetical protein
MYYFPLDLILLMESIIPRTLRLTALVIVEEGDYCIAGCGGVNGRLTSAFNIL